MYLLHKIRVFVVIVDSVAVCHQKTLGGLIGSRIKQKLTK